jgi:predicted aspartyl protease
MEGNVIISGRRTPPTGAGSLRASWSRRRFIANGSLSVAFACSLPWAIARERSESAPRVAQVDGAAASSPASGGSGSVASATDMTGRLSTTISIDGAGPYRFMVDTGAERTVIAEDIARSLALPRGREVLVQGIVLGAPAALVKIRRLEIGSLVCTRLEVPTLPRAMLNADGYLGLDVLDGRRVIFDFMAGTLTVTKPLGFFSALWTHGDEARVRTMGSSGRLRATDCVVDDVRAAAFIDSGAQISVINTALYAALQRHRASQTMDATTTITGVTGGSIVGITTLIDMIRLSELVLTFETVVVADLPVFKLWGLNRQPALLIGMDCLRRCARVSIDYGRKELRFQVASAQEPQWLQAELPPPLAG